MQRWTMPESRLNPNFRARPVTGCPTNRPARPEQHNSMSAFHPTPVVPDLIRDRFRRVATSLWGRGKLDLCRNPSRIEPGMTIAPCAFYRCGPFRQVQIQLPILSSAARLRHHSAGCSAVDLGRSRPHSRANPRVISACSAIQAWYSRYLASSASRCASSVLARQK